MAVIPINRDCVVMEENSRIHERNRRRMSTGFLVNDGLLGFVPPADDGARFAPVQTVEGVCRTGAFFALRLRFPSNERAKADSVLLRMCWSATRHISGPAVGFHCPIRTVQC